MWRQVGALIKNEWLLEVRHKYGIGGIGLYALAAISVIYFSLQQSQISEINKFVWNILFWMVVIFSALNAIAKSFFQYSRGKMLYLYTTVDPQALLLSKVIYNVIYLLVLGVFNYLVFTLVLENPVENIVIFAASIFLGTFGLASLFTLMSMIASKSGNNMTLMAILGLPLVIPLIVFLMRLSTLAFLNFTVEFWKPLLLLLAFNTLVLAMSLILFPYIWRD